MDNSPAITCRAVVVMGATMNKLWIGLVIGAALTLALAPSGQPALPEPGVRKVMATVFGDDE